MKNKIILILTSFFLISSFLLTSISLNIIPLVIKKETFVYEYGHTEISTNLADYITANEFVMNAATLDLSDVSNDVGVYIALVNYMNKDYPFYIKVVDTIKPVAKLKEVEVFIEVGSTLVASDLVEIIEENSKSSVYFNDNFSYEEEKLYLLAGTYIENIIVVDSSNNSSSNLRIKISVGKKTNTPVLSGCFDKTIELNSLFNPYQGVSAQDGLGVDITSRINIIKNKVDTSKVGEYEVTYSVTNIDGNTTQKTIKVTVE